MKDLPNFLYIHIILLIKSPSNFRIYQRDSPIFYTYKSRGGFLKSSLPRKIIQTQDEKNNNSLSMIYRFAENDLL